MLDIYNTHILDEHICIYTAIYILMVEMQTCRNISGEFGYKIINEG